MGAGRRTGGRRPGGLGRAFWAVAACLGLALAGLAAVPQSTVQASAAVPASGCAAAAVGRISCAALVTPGVRSVSASAMAASSSLPPGLGPLSLRYAYGLENSSLTGGVGQTVAVVTEYDDPTAESDMATYRSDYSIPPCGSGCFTKVDENGGTDYPVSNPAWSAATSESLDMISAICPNCHILLVEAGTTTNGSATVGITDLGAAENTAVNLGADFITNTWYTSEATYGTSEGTYDSDYFNHPGVAITAPDGNGQGYGTYYPAASPYVIAVGGTTLTADPSSPRGWTETVWGGTGSGCSPYEPKPSWQTDTGCSNRMLNDTAAVADNVNSPVAFYDDDPDSGDSGWITGGGNDVSSALVAAAFALAGTPAAGTYPASYLYAHATPGLVNPITSGSDGTCTPVYFCAAGPGYNGPAGVGTIASATALGAYAPDEVLAGEPAVVDPATGSLDVFGTGTKDGTAWVDTWTSSGGWGDWTSLGGDLDAKPYSALYDPASGNIEVYALAPNSDVYEDYSSNGTSWSGWQDLGGDYEAAPSAVFNPLTNSVDVWEVATSGTAFVDSWNPATGWSGWQNKSGEFTAGGLSAMYDPVHTTMDVFGVGNENGTVWGTSYTSASGPLSGSGTGEHSGWNNMNGNLTGILSAIYDPTTAIIEVYGQDTAGYTEETDTFDPASGWSDWHYLYDDGPVLTHPPFAVYNPLDNSIEVWAAASNETAWDDSWTTSGGWTTWQNKGGYIISGIDAVFDSNSGDLRAFGVGPENGTVWTASIAPSGSTSAWVNISGTLQSGDF
jgi:hypothetical protein